jgi:hypothetical protein
VVKLITRVEAMSLVENEIERSGVVSSTTVDWDSFFTDSGLSQDDSDYDDELEV